MSSTSYHGVEVAGRVTPATVLGPITTLTTAVLVTGPAPLAAAVAMFVVVELSVVVAV